MKGAQLPTEDYNSNNNNNNNNQNVDHSTHSDLRFRLRLDAFQRSPRRINPVTQKDDRREVFSIDNVRDTPCSRIFVGAC